MSNVLKICQLNVEGLAMTKSEFFGRLLKKTNYDVLEETHKQNDNSMDQCALFWLFNTDHKQMAMSKMFVTWTANGAMVTIKMAFVQRCRRQRKTTTLFFPGKINMAEKLKNDLYGHPFNGAGVRRISRSAKKMTTWNVRSIFQAGKLQNIMQ